MNLLDFIEFKNEPYDIETCLVALTNCFIATRGQKKMKSSDLIEAICKKEISWTTYNKGNQITPDQLDSLLKAFGIKSRKIKFNTGKEIGFYSKWFSDLVEVIDEPLKFEPDIVTQKPTTMNSLNETYGESCLIALIDCANVIEGEPKMKLKEIVEAICIFRKELWATYDNGLPITPELLVSMLNECGIKGENIEFDDGFEMGYYGKTFSERVRLESKMPETDNPKVMVGDHELMIIPRIGSVKPLE